MKKFIILICSIILCITLVGCINKNSQEKVKDIGIDEFKQSMLKKYDLEKVDITEDEDNKKMTIAYYFSLGPIETDMEAVKYQSLLYYKPREKKYDTLIVNVYSQTKELAKVFTYENGKWVEEE